MTTYRHVFTAAALLTMLWAGGCTTARMALPPDMPASVTAMPVEGRKAFGWNESFQFGPHRVESVRRGWKKSTTWSFFGFEQGKARQTYEFTFRPPEGPVWKVHCATGVRWKELELDNFLESHGTLNWQLKSDTSYVCTFESDKDAPMWKLVMEQGTGEWVLNGVLTDGKTAVSVEGIRALQGSSWPLMEPSGFVFRAPEGVVGAVEVINNGTVWIAPGVPSEVRHALACASSSLLLYKVLE